MAGTTNFFFNNFQSSQEQLLLENLTIEAMGIYGHDIYYIPRKLNNYDPVYGADDQSSYEQAIPIVMYIESVDGFTGDLEFFSRMGAEVRNQFVFALARRTFEDEVTSITSQIRPNESDLIWFPLNQRLFVIRYVDKYEFFYQLGKIYTYRCTAEVFEYAGENINTGIPEIDAVQKSMDNNILDFTIQTELGDYLMTEDGDYVVLESYGEGIGDLSEDNDTIQQQSDQFVDFTSVDPFSEGHV